MDMKASSAAIHELAEGTRVVALLSRGCTIRQYEFATERSNQEFAPGDMGLMVCCALQQFKMAHVGLGSKPESAPFGLMSAFPSSGHGPAMLTAASCQ
jgi:hypothetical protein